MAMRALDRLKAEGANLEKVNICQVNGASNWKKIPDRGAGIGMDCFGLTLGMMLKRFAKPGRSCDIIHARAA